MKYITKEGCEFELPFEVSLNKIPDFHIETYPSCPNLESGKVRIISNHNLLFALDSFTHSAQLYYDGLASNKHTIKVKDSIGCMAHLDFEIGELPNLEVEFPQLFSDCFQEELVIEPNIFQSASDIKYLWNNGSNSTSIRAAQAGNYSVTITDACDEITHEWQINKTSLSKDQYFIFPNIISRSSQNENNCFRPEKNKSLEITSYDLKIFDRWGSLVFSSTEPNECWYGSISSQKLETGVYVFILNAVVSHCNEEERITKIHDVTVLD